jgi:hypothetical protein
VDVDIIGPNLNGADQRKGYLHVHRAGCRDAERMKRKYGQDAAWSATINSVEEGVREVYADHLEESGTDDWESYNDLHFAPCTLDLPYTAEG